MSVSDVIFCKSMTSHITIELSVVYISIIICGFVDSKFTNHCALVYNMAFNVYPIFLYGSCLIQAWFAQLLYNLIKAKY